MSERGFTLLEAILAVAMATIVMAGLSTFYLSTVRFANENAAQTALQRQASFIVDELAREIGPATLLEYPVTCSGDPNGFRVTNGCGTFCFYRGIPAGSTAPAILEDRTLSVANPACANPNQNSGTGTWNLLSGALIPATGDAGLLSTVSTACSATAGGFCPTLIRQAATNCVTGAAVTFRLGYQVPESQSHQLMTFSTSVGGRALPVVTPPATCP